jgi:hypothetical protein
MLVSSVLCHHLIPVSRDSSTGALLGALFNSLDMFVDFLFNIETLLCCLLVRRSLYMLLLVAKLRLDVLFQFKELAQAYEVLSDPEKREVYDQYGEDALKEGMGGGGGMHDPFDIFQSFFGGSPFGGMSNEKQDCTVSLSLGLAYAMSHILSLCRWWQQ